MEQIDGKVAKTLSATALVLNVGAKDGVQEGMKFRIYAMGDEIVDPETKASLGRLEIAKGDVTIVNVQENISTAEAVTRTIQRTRIVDPLNQWLNPFGPKQVTEDVKIADRIKIYVDQDSYTAQLTVRPGDLARSMD